MWKIVWGIVQVLILWHILPIIVMLVLAIVAEIVGVH